MGTSTAGWLDDFTLELDFIMEDAKALEVSWRATGYFKLRPEWELGEISCSGDYFGYRIEN